jgi:TolB protein
VKEKNKVWHFTRWMIFPIIILLAISGCTPSSTETPVFTPDSPTETPFAPARISIPTPVIFSDFPGIFILSLSEGEYTHLFAYSPIDQPMLRLTSGKWQDTSPALSPDGEKIAFASNRSGYWDIYLLEIASGETTRLTETKTYDGAPTWSPDGAWLATETYLDGNLEILVQPISDSSAKAIRLTNNAAADHSPAWEPDGRRIAFVSTRGGDSDIYLADLNDTSGGRFINISNTPKAIESHPIWSRDGHTLAWASNAYNDRPNGIYIWNRTTPHIPASWVGEGNRAAWNARGDSLLAMLKSENKNYLTAYALDGALLLQPYPLPGTLDGMIWLPDALPEELPKSYSDSAALTPAPLWEKKLSTPEALSVRQNLSELENVQAPYPQIHDAADESFIALRESTITRAGWDALANLENAFIPLTTSLDPGLGDDWLYTGRAFSLNPLITSAGWMVAVRHEIGQQTFWNLYLRAQIQDGSMGLPLHDPIWDLSTRYNLDPASYEAGGSFAPVPAGYWVDFSALAENYGWQGLPALSNWRNFYKGTRYTQFLYKENLSWYEAMLELYPPEILVTPTLVLPPSKTPTITPRPTNTPWPTRTPFTPVPTSTPFSIFGIGTATP